MEPIIIGLRAQDFHESLKSVSTFGPKDVGFRRTLLIGKAAALAMHLRGLLFISDYTQLEYAASALGISSIELPAVLHELECLDFLSIVKAGDEVKRVELRIPAFRSGYEDLGERLKQLKPTETEQAGLVTLDRLYQGPVQRELLKNQLGLQPVNFAALFDVMAAGMLLAEQPVDGEPIIYTPLAIDGNPGAYLQWAKRFPQEIQQLLNNLRAGQGVPISFLKSSPALEPAVGTGVLMPVEVNGATGSQRFLFSPIGGLKPEERPILNKARAIVSCVRYGQHFAAGRSILYPRRILETLKHDKRFKRGHPDLFNQYSLLAEEPRRPSSQRRQWSLEFPNR
jgi:hypothetical protein